MAESPRRTRDVIRCTQITMINDEDGIVRVVGESLGSWETILVHTPKYPMALELSEEERFFDAEWKEPDTIPCEKITMFQNENGGVRVVGESQERGVITLLWSPSPHQKMFLNKAQPALFT